MMAGHTMKGTSMDYTEAQTATLLRALSDAMALTGRRIEDNANEGDEGADEENAALESYYQRLRDLAATIVDPTSDLAADILDDEGAYGVPGVDYVEAWHQYAATHSPDEAWWLAAHLEVCPTHGCDTSICADDETVCEAGQGDRY